MFDVKNVSKVIEEIRIIYYDYFSYIVEDGDWYVCKKETYG